MDVIKKKVISRKASYKGFSRITFFLWIFLVTYGGGGGGRGGGARQGDKAFRGAGREPVIT
jgi:hypothetical protein